MVGERLHNLVLQFEAVNERLATIHIRVKYFNIRLICAHTPTEYKDDVTKESFYELLDQTYESCPRHDVKIVLGEFNAKVGNVEIVGPTIGKFSFHVISSNNG